jgi:hypothetical protein
MPLRYDEEIRREGGITPQGADTLENISRVQVENLAVNDDFGAGKFRTAWKFRIDDFVKLSGRSVGQI